MSEPEESRPAQPPGGKEPPSSALTSDVIWQTLAAEPGTGVSLLRADGLIIYTNMQASLGLTGLPNDQIVGKNIRDLFPEAWVRERMDLFHRMGSHNELAMIRSIWRGREVRSTIRWIPGKGEEQNQFLVLTRFGSGTIRPQPVSENVEVVESKLVELGRLDVLTTRELEVLALIGQGLRLKKIAEILHRAPKTIENHRLAIGRKLGETDRVRLATIASEAGLTMSDAALARVRPRPD